jgi:RNase P/RNase MRP subunit p30
MINHTPGPWRVRTTTRQDGKGGFKVYDVVTKHIGLRITQLKGLSPKIRANANLIAAAPEMLEALKEAREDLEDIINATGNNQPYTPDELISNFKALNLINVVINKATSK